MSKRANFHNISPDGIILEDIMIKIPVDFMKEKDTGLNKKVLTLITEILSTANLLNRKN